MKTKTYAILSTYRKDLVNLTEGQKKFWDWLEENGYLSNDICRMTEFNIDKVTTFSEEETE